MQTMQITVPPNAWPGQQIQVQTPGGVMNVTIPDGAAPGSLVAIQVPGNAPSSMAPEPIHVTQPLLGAVSPDSMFPDHSSIPVGQPVAQAMPHLPSASSLTDHYSGFRYSTDHPEEAGRHHAAAFDPKSGIQDAASAVPMGTAVFYTPEQLVLLDQQPLPADIFSTGVKQHGRPTSGQVLPAMGLAVAQDASAAIAQPVLTTAAGVPIINTSVAGLSPAKTHYDGWHGIKSCDVRLQHSIDELMLFFNTHNSRPLLGCQVEGWHHETRHRRRRVTDANGKSHWETHTYVERVIDFRYKVDLTSFVYPFGYIASVDENQLSVPQLCDKFVTDANLLKSLAMKKEVQFDFRALHAMIYGYIRSLGWRRGLTVSFPKANSSVRVYHENWLSSMWESCFGYLLCHLAILPCIIMRIYRGDCCCSADHAEEDIRSFFRINYAPVQVFEAIRAQLWCPGFSGAALAMELLRDIFW